MARSAKLAGQPPPEAVAAMSATRGVAGPGVPPAEALAEAAGLRRAWVEHRADVEEAVAAVAVLRAALSRPADPTAEPAPPYAMPPRPVAHRRDDSR
jgi:hypothetical protein